MILSKLMITAPSLGVRNVIKLNAKNALNCRMILRFGGNKPRLLRARPLPKRTVFHMFLRYTLIGFVPAILFVSCCNLLIGDAVLYDHDPELYEPEFWEYYKHPIARFLAKYCVEDPKVSYYKDILNVENNARKIRQRKLIKQVEKLQKLEQQGYVQWYDDPAITRPLIVQTEEYVEKNLPRSTD